MAASLAEDDPCRPFTDHAGTKWTKWGSVTGAVSQDFVLLGRRADGVAGTRQLTELKVDDHFADLLYPGGPAATDELTQVSGQSSQQRADPENLPDLFVGADQKPRRQRCGSQNTVAAMPIPAAISRVSAAITPAIAHFGTADPWRRAMK